MLDLPVRSTLRKYYDNDVADERTEPKQYDWAEPRTSPLRPKSSRQRAKQVADELRPRQQLGQQPLEGSQTAPARTFQEYLEKYYGVVDRRDRVLSDDELSQHSDSAIDYSEDRLHPG